MCARLVLHEFTIGQLPEHLSSEAQYHNHLTRQYAGAIACLPIENVSSITSLGDLFALPAKIKTASDVLEIEAMSQKMTTNLEQWVQLREALVESNKLLKAGRSKVQRDTQNIEKSYRARGGALKPWCSSLQEYAVPCHATTYKLKLCSASVKL